MYIMYKTFRFLFGTQGQILWHFLTPKVRNKKEPAVSQEKPQRKTEAEPYSIVGKSQTVYMEESPKAATPAEHVISVPVEPAFSEDLQQVAAYEEESDISAEEIEDNLDEERFTDEERFLSLDTPEDNGNVSTGLTYEQISRTIEVVQGKKMNEADRLDAARTLFEVQGSDLYDLLLMQAENEAVIERLLKENLDNAGEIPAAISGKKRREIEDFDMDKYV